MKIEEFINELDKRGWGIAIFNTYHLNGKNCFFMIVNFKSSSGQFMKKEGLINQLNNAFIDIIGEFE